MYETDGERFNQRDASSSSIFAIGPIGMIVLLAIIVFFNSLFNAFVWDDKTYLLISPVVHVFDINALVGPNMFNTLGHYRPIPAIYFAALYSVTGEFPFLYHLVQLAIHITNASLVYVLFTRLFINRKVSLFLSAVFLVHPIQVESVSYIAASGNPLFFLFGISALLLSIREDVSHKRLLCIASLLLLSLLTKETGFLFVLAALLYRVLFRRSRHIAGFFLATTAAALIYLLLRFAIGGVYLQKLYLVPIARLTLTERLMNIPAIISHYMTTVFYPAQLAINQNWVVDSVTVTSFYLPLIFTLILVVLAIYARFQIAGKRSEAHRAYLFFASWFVLGLAIHLQVFPLDLTVADRWFYFPLAGLLGMIGVCFSTLSAPKRLRTIGIGVAAIILVLLSVRTMVRNTNWQDPITLYTHDAAIHNNEDIQNNLGGEYSLRQDNAAALTHYKKSVEMFPDEGNLFNLGNTYEVMGDLQNAKKYYLEALDSQVLAGNYSKHPAVLYYRLNWVLIITEKPEMAEGKIKDSINAYPDDPNLWIQYALIEYKLHKQDAALAAAETARTLSATETASQLYELIRNREPVPFSADQRTVSWISP
jgi:hypothetical protein